MRTLKHGDVEYWLMQEHSSANSLVVWVPAPREIVAQMLALAGVSGGDVVYDLGCGDGRVLISAVKDFAAKRAVGYELRQDLCEISRRLVRQLDLQDRIEIINGDLLKADLSGASVVTLYLTGEANRMLSQRLERGLRPGSRVVTYLFPVSGWLPAKEVDLENLCFTEGKFIGKLYLYVMPQASLHARTGGA